MDKTVHVDTTLEETDYYTHPSWPMAFQAGFRGVAVLWQGEAFSGRSYCRIGSWVGNSEAWRAGVVEVHHLAELRILFWKV